MSSEQLLTCFVLTKARREYSVSHAVALTERDLTKYHTRFHSKKSCKFTVDLVKGDRLDKHIFCIEVYHSYASMEIFGFSSFADLKAFMNSTLPDSATFFCEAAVNSEVESFLTKEFSRIKTIQPVLSFSKMYGTKWGTSPFSDSAKKEFVFCKKENK